jgi:hypothetical protein
MEGTRLFRAYLLDWTHFIHLNFVLSVAYREGVFLAVGNFADCFSIDRNFELAN